MKDYAVLTGAFLNAGDSGVQVYSATIANSVATAFIYSYLPDTSTPVGSGFTTGEIVFYAGTMVENSVALDQRDTQFFAGPSDTYIATASRALVRITSGQAKILKLAAQDPSSSPVSVTLVNGLPLYLQSENVGRAYWLYQPSVQTPVSARQRDRAPLACTECYLEGKFPSVDFAVGGKQLAPASASPGGSSGATLFFDIPKDAPLGMVEVKWDIQGVKKSTFLTVRSSAEPATPVITSLLPATLNPAAGETGPLAPRMVASLAYTGGVPGMPDPSSVSLTLSDGTPFRVLSVVAPGQLRVMVPASVTGKKTQDAVTLALTGASVTVSSSPFAVNFASRFDLVDRYPDLESGVLVPYLADAGGRLVGGQLNPVPNGSTVTAYGTGCGLAGSLADSQNPADQSVTDPNPPNLNFGGVLVPLQSVVLVPNFAGTCAYTFAVPQGLSGSVRFWFGTGTPVGPVYQVQTQ